MLEPIDPYETLVAELEYSKHLLETATALIEKGLYQEAWRYTRRHAGIAGEKIALARQVQQAHGAQE